MSSEHLVFETIKLLAQAALAAGVAYFAVRWALSRFKREKTWERRLSAYADAVAAMSEILFILGLWMEAIENNREHNEKIREDQISKYKDATARLRDSTAIARLIQPNETYQMLHTLEMDIENITECDAHTAYCLEYSLIEDALVQLTNQGRASLEVDSKRWFAKVRD